MEGLLLILLRPTTIGGVHATVDARGVRTHGREATTLLEGTLPDIHTPCIAHTVRFATTIFGAEPILHEFIIRFRSHIDSDTVRIGTVMTMNTWSWAIYVCVLFIITITLETRGIL